MSDTLWSKDKSPISNYTEASTTRQIEFAGCKITMKSGEIVITNGSATLRLSGGNIYLN